MAIALNGCAEMELASHVAKKTVSPPAGQSKGRFKVGSPYKIAGKTYYPRETYSFEQTGIASWYGPNFHGKKTANGEIFDMYELTAAHKTLQMPSLVRVTNLENGRSIIVRINDRGPFSKGRIIDMSKRGAELLGFINQGTARVKVQVLSEESRKIGQAAKQGLDTRRTEVAMNKPGFQPISQQKREPITRQPMLTKPQNTQVASNAGVPAVESVALDTNIPGHINNGNFYPDPVVKQGAPKSTKIYVQAGAFSNPANAENLAASLKSVGNAHVDPSIVNGRNFYRVRIGPLDSVPQADQMLAQLSQRGRYDAIVVVD